MKPILGNWTFVSTDKTQNIKQKKCFDSFGENEQRARESAQWTNNQKMFKNVIFSFNVHLK